MALVLASEIPKRSVTRGGLAFLASVQPDRHALKGNPFFPYIKHLYSSETDTQSIDPMLLPICTTDTLRSATPDGRFARNCANAERKESSCPQICQEIALRWKDVGPDNNE